MSGSVNELSSELATNIWFLQSYCSNDRQCRLEEKCCPCQETRLCRIAKQLSSAKKIALIPPSSQDIGQTHLLSQQLSSVPQYPSTISQKPSSGQQQQPSIRQQSSLIPQEQSSIVPQQQSSKPQPPSSVQPQLSSIKASLADLSEAIRTALSQIETSSTQNIPPSVLSQAALSVISKINSSNQPLIIQPFFSHTSASIPPGNNTLVTQTHTIPLAHQSAAHTQRVEPSLASALSGQTTFPSQQSPQQLQVPPLPAIHQTSMNTVPHGYYFAPPRPYGWVIYIVYR